MTSQEETAAVSVKAPKVSPNKGRRNVSGAWIVFEGSTPVSIHADEVDALRIAVTLANGGARFIAWGSAIVG